MVIIWVNFFCLSLTQFPGPFNDNSMLSRLPILIPLLSIRHLYLKSFLYIYVLYFCTSNCVLEFELPTVCHKSSLRSSSPSLLLSNRVVSFIFSDSFGAVITNVTRIIQICTIHFCTLFFYPLCEKISVSFVCIVWTYDISSWCFFVLLSQDTDMRIPF